MKSIIKAFSFLAKEFHDIRRQPRLLLSLVGGPLLVLAAFGATFRSANPFITTVLVPLENCRRLDLAPFNVLAAHDAASAAESVNG